MKIVDYDLYSYSDYRIWFDIVSSNKGYLWQECIEMIQKSEGNF